MVTGCPLTFSVSLPHVKFVQAAQSEPPVPKQVFRLDVQINVTLGKAGSCFLNVHWSKRVPSVLACIREVDSMLANITAPPILVLIFIVMFGLF